MYLFQAFMMMKHTFTGSEWALHFAVLLCSCPVTYIQNRSNHIHKFTDYIFKFHTRDQTSKNTNILLLPIMQLHLDCVVYLAWGSSGAVG